MTRRIVSALLGAAVIAGLILGPAAPAAAHPLGNFSVNHYHGLRLHPDRLDDLAVLDQAEIPTLQAKSSVDTDGDGTITAGERSSFAVSGCQQLMRELHATVDGRPVSWTVIASDFSLHEGAANLKTSRTECRLTATVDLRHGATVEVSDTYRLDRVGWREITAAADGVALLDPPVPDTSTSDELRQYPDDLLASPLDQRTVTLRTTEGAGPGSTAAPAIPVPGTVGRGLNALTDQFYAIAGSRHLGLAVGLLGVGLALLLGAAHAALPGHGKTVMAAYIAGRRGTIRDAVTVGVTVTVTHTAGVLVLGLLLTLVVGLVGEIVLGWLGVASGLLVAGIGVSLLRSAVRRRRRSRGPQPVPESAPVRASVGALATVDSSPPPRPVHTGHDHTGQGSSHGHSPHDHSHRDESHLDRSHHGHSHRGHSNHGHSHDGHSHFGGSHHEHRHGENWSLGRRGLVGLGIAGGLVPSPSALVVLLGAIALGHTWFGVLLVVAYGLGMAATLTAAGLALVVLRRRLDEAAARRFGRWSGRISAATPVLTAALVLMVGLGLAARGALPLLT